MFTKEKQLAGKAKGLRHLMMQKNLYLDKIILKGIDIRQAVDTLNNVSVATIQTSITFSVGLIIVALLG